MCFGGGGGGEPPRQPESKPVLQQPAGDSQRTSTAPRYTPTTSTATQLTRR